MNRSVLRSVLTYGLIVILVTTVLRFGGTDPVDFSGLQAGIFLLTATALWCLRDRLLLTRPVRLAPLLLAAYVGLQWLMLVESRALIEIHLPRLLASLCVFALAFLLGQDRGLRWRLVLALLALGSFEALYGLIQYMTGWHHIFGYRKIFYTAQATGTYINPNHFANFLAMLLGLSLGMALYGLDRVLQSEERGGGSGYLKGEQAPRFIFYFFLSLILFLGILFSRSRMGIFSALAAVVAVILLWGSVSWSRARVISVLGVFLLGAGALGVWVGLEPVIERYQLVSEDYLLRESIWKDTLKLIRTQPIFGSGLGTFETHYTRHQTIAVTNLVDHAHNDYLQLTAELGLVGAALVFALIFTAWGRMIVSFRRAGRNRDRYLLLGCAGGVLAILFHSLADFNLQLPANTMVFAVLLGLGCALSERHAAILPRSEQPK
jgi:putative inorganic carbon (HCO3(-)) transporter